jgi:hypothetical protein
MLTSCNRCQGRNSNSSGKAGTSRSATPHAGTTMKENLGLTGRFLLTLVTKAADIVGDNPAQVALGLVKAIVEIKNVRCCPSHHILTDDHSRM